MTTDMCAVAGSCSAVPGQLSIEGASLGLSYLLSPSCQLDHGFPIEDGSLPPCCCGHVGGRRFFGPAGRLNYTSINQLLNNAA